MQSLSQMQSDTNSAPTNIPKAIPLVESGMYSETKKIFLNFSEEAICKINSSFDPNKKFCVIVSAGMVGVGKSTWNNALVYAISNKKEPVFEVGESQVTQTEGIWFLPEPLTYDSQADTQILLLDMEGMSGIRPNVSKEETKAMLQKLYLIGMATSSVFCLHTNVRPTSEEIENLKQVFSILRELQLKLGIDVPKIYIFVQDTNEIKMKNGTSETFENFLAKNCEIPEELMKLITILPRGRVPESYLEEKSYKELHQSPYLKMIHRFLLEAVKYSKKTHGLTSDLILKDLIKFFCLMRQIINSRDFETYFMNNLEQKILDLAIPKQGEIAVDFHEKINTLSKEFSVERTVEEFDVCAAKLKDECTLKFDNFVKETFRQSLIQSQALKNVTKILDETMKNEIAKRLFISRKIAAENDKNAKEALEKLKCESEEAEKKLKLEKQKYIDDIKRMKENFIREDEAKKKEHLETLQKIQEEKQKLCEQLALQIRDKEILQIDNQKMSEKIEDMKLSNEKDKEQLAQLQRFYEQEMATLRRTQDVMMMMIQSGNALRSAESMTKTLVKMMKR